MSSIIRKKRTENKNNILSKNRIIIYSDINKNEIESSEYNENIISNNNKEIDNKKNQNIDINYNDINDNNRYPNFQSFLQLYPKDDAKIPQIKYVNYIFNIGSPIN